MALKRHYAIRVVYLSNIIIAICALVVLALGLWMMNACTFLDELLRNRLYMDTGYTIVIASCFIVGLAAFGCIAGYKQIKCLLLTYTVFMFLLFVVMVVGGVLAYIFREQVENTIKAEMIADIRNYDPGEPEKSVTKAWDETQSQLECCGLMTEQVSEAWQMWRYNKLLNPGPEGQMVPESCCLPELDCRQDNVTITDNIWPGDCMRLSIQYVRQHAAILGIANVTVCFFLLFGLLASLSLFRSIV